MKRLLLLAGLGLFAATSCGTTSPPSYLSATGRAQWHSEMRLRQRYGEVVCTSFTSPTGFASGFQACTPHADHSFYIYHFLKSGLPRDHVVWNLEALLHDTFGSGAVWSNGTTFVTAKPCCSGSFYVYKYLFASGRRSGFHLISPHPPGGSFGNYPAPVRIDRRYVACDPHNRTYLTYIYATVGDSYACLAPL